MEKSMEQRSFVYFVLLFVTCFVCSCDFTRSKKLQGTNFELNDVTGLNVGLYYCMKYPSVKEVLPEYSCINDIKSVFWNKQYILAYSVNKETNTIEAYYIVEQLSTDTLVDGVPWTTYSELPYTYEEYTDYNAFCQRMEQLHIDTLNMRHFSWNIFF